MLRLNAGMKSSEDGGVGTLSIGVLAARFGLATQVLRHWEAMGLLHPGRDAGRRRRYGADDLTRVAAILILKEAGLGLNTIRSLSATVDRATRQEILHPAAEELRLRIAAAQASLELIEGGLNCEYEDVTQCPNYRRLIAERADPRSTAGAPVIEAVAPTS
ncbi:MerR family transcriptional regulator [Streptomyces sp. NBC_00264]|uniref:MerR family transcriptional regulator n=1 Tax=unclassified Streptomyces TaxID=2593676 RepID=UPI002259808E|nr:MULTISPECIES: MerR family transcriptional regulator [unclassified Streptomyces]MCX5165571.1 MerR family transcriptional regulator [Streptomyces sp. NBC_00305]MCX5224296.1 MerR family transcriptional regulator [Streptomyces sp. NBC_00264]